MGRYYLNEILLKFIWDVILKYDSDKRKKIHVFAIHDQFVRPVKARLCEREHVLFVDEPNTKFVSSCCNFENTKTELCNPNAT